MRIHERIARDLRTLRAFGRMIPNVVRARPSGSFTVADAIEEIARRRPNQLALVFEDQSVSYAELDREANRVARWAQSQNIRRGDVVALLMENRPEFVIHWLGLAKIGAVTALINTNLLGKPLAHSLSISGARHLILDAALTENWQSVQGELARPLDLWASGGDVAGAQDLDADRASRSPNALPRDVREGLTGADKLFYIYTSGTTGLPKAANFSHTRFVAVASGGAALGDLNGGDRMYIVLPLYHSAGGAMALGGTLLTGATAVLARRFSASRFWEDCVRYDVTTFQYIGELCRYLLNSPPHPDESRHRIRVCVGNGLRPEVWQPFQDRFALPRIVEFYGATEGNVTFTNLDNKIGSIGRMPALLRRVSGVHLVRFDVAKEDVVRGPDGFCIECGVDEPGEALGRINDTTRFEGYSDAQASEKKILRDVFVRGDSYFRTGDLLRRDADDYFYFVDRIGDTFRWKGENVSTGEVAEVLATCPGVREANVYGVEVAGADGRAGMASLVVDDDFDLETFHREVESELPSYARPLFVRLLPEIEITGTFKHRKVESMKEGFDPSRVADPLYFLDSKEGRYVRLDQSLHDRIQSGAIRV
jgi:fatty-acyl-CoA synthase